jgi:hypothetical protein
MMAQHFRTGLAILMGAALIPFAVEAQSPPPPDGVCFEIVPGTSEMLPGSPILLNKCTGDSFFLSRKQPPASAGRKAQATYQWLPIGRAIAVEGMAKLEPSGTAGAKCFSYDGRQFCH